ncbi:MAG: hypothetical protein IPO18_09400 [bacterium]|nr:hypothetical protein [bacterium]
MGEVYRADDLELGQSVTLKFPPESVSRNAAELARFRNEVRVARQIAHPNVCRVYDIGEIDGPCSCPWSTSTARTCLGAAPEGATVVRQGDRDRASGLPRPGRRT